MSVMRAAVWTATMKKNAEVMRVFMGSLPSAAVPSVKRGRIAGGVGLRLCDS